MDYSNRMLVHVRRLGQRMGILRPLQRLYRQLAGSQYEERFNRALEGSIKPGIVVWDVGANVGLYTKQFAETVAGGCVVAFEPSPEAAASIRSHCAGLANVTVMEAALSDSNGVAHFEVTSGTAPTNSLRNEAREEHSPGTISVRVARGDDLISAGECPLPNVIKIDIEGFELEALQGLDSTLSKPELQAVFIEVHFQKLNQRGLTDAPRQIAQMLNAKGFSVTWCDPSHIAATRPQRKME